MDLTNLEQLKDSIDAHKAEQEESKPESFDHQELTDDEKAALQNMERPMVGITDNDGNVQPLDEYAQPLDDNTISVIDSDGVQKDIKSMNTAAIKKDLIMAKADAARQIIELQKQTGGQDIDEDELFNITDKALEIIRERLGLEKLTVKTFNKRVRGMSLRELCDILPRTFATAYLSDEEIDSDDFNAKQRVLTAISYAITIGPEYAEIDSDLEEYERMRNIGQRLIEMRFDISEVIRSPEKLSEIISRTMDVPVINTGGWIARTAAKCIQSFIFHHECELAYAGIIDEYDDAASRDAIQEEIDGSIKCEQVYKSVMNIETMTELWHILMNRYKSDNRFKSRGVAFLRKEAISAIERIKRCKTKLSFPTFNTKLSGSETAILDHYLIEEGKFLATKQY